MNTLAVIAHIVAIIVIIAVIVWIVALYRQIGQLKHELAQARSQSTPSGDSSPNPSQGN